MIYRILICDDNEEERRELAALAEEYCRGKAEIVLCTDGDGLMGTLREGGADVILLDIEMPGENGIAIKERLEAARIKSYIIFVTSHMNFMQEAFGKNVVGYIEKPPQKDKLYKIFSSINDNRIQNREIEVETVLGKVKKIWLDHVRYIKADRMYSVIYAGEEKICMRKSLNQWEEELEEEYFVRINRSYLVNLRYVTQIDGKQIYMKDEEKAKGEKKKVKQVFNLTRDKDKREKKEQISEICGCAAHAWYMLKVKIQAISQQLQH